jgi:hypothetical protein
MADAYTNEALAAAREYFRQGEPRFWLWGDDAISWTDGATIVFHAELAELLRRLSVDGLPRFTPLLLLLSACRENYHRERVTLALAQERAGQSGVTSGINAEADELLQALDRVAALPNELRYTLDAKAALVDTVFAGRRDVCVKDALGAAELLKTMPAAELFGEGTPAGVAIRPGDTRLHVTSALLEMREGLLRVDADALRLRLRTGLDRLVEPAKLELPADNSLRAFISRLRADPELSGLGRLAHDLMAAVQVPRGLCEPEELRLGGVSDIANHGPLDRLLVSELAHDDLTLAVRVAVGEALYLRREAPPRTPVRQRHLLIDCGIRLWGVPRVFATAVGLALAATTDRRGQVNAWRSAADGMEAIDLATREGLIGLLEKLEATPQPGAALARFFATVDDAQTAADTILITHEDVVADQDFRRALGELGNRFFYVVTVERSGRFRLLALSGRGTKVLREAQFNLESLLAPAARPTVPLVRHNEGADFPVILSVEPFPFLLRHEVNYERTAFHPDYGAVTITHDGRLMHWRQAGEGAVQITASLPAGPIKHLSMDDEGVVRVVVTSGNAAAVRLVLADLTSGECRVMTVVPEVETPQSVVFHQRTLFLIARRTIRVVDDRGQATPPLPFIQHHRGGRFFASGVWYALSFDGHMPILTRVPVHSSIALGSIAAMFDIEGRDGPWVITTQGRVACTLDGTIVWGGAHQNPMEFARLAKNVSLCDKRQWGKILLAPKSGVSVRLLLATAATAHFAVPELRGLLRSGSLQHRFQRIGIDGDRRLTLVGRRGRSITFSPTLPSGPALIVCPPASELRRSRPFEPTASPGDVGYSLRVASWADGSRAWLDSRGMLHLKSSDLQVPEITIVLVHSGEIAAWASDGRLWGPPFYTGLGAGDARSGAELLAEIDAFVARLV